MNCYRPLVSGCLTEAEYQQNAREDKLPVECAPDVREHEDVPEGTTFGVGDFSNVCAPWCGPLFGDATPDGHDVVVGHPKFPQDVQLTSVPNAGLEYEWHEGRLQPLYLLPDGEGAARGSEAEEGIPQAIHALPDDGAVFFTYLGHVYGHDFDADSSARLDVAHGVTEPEASEASFLYATPMVAGVLLRPGSVSDTTAAACPMPHRGRLLRTDAHHAHWDVRGR